MSGALNEQTRERMAALCKKIAVAHDLDEEIQTELLSHLEDKLLGYLSGEEAVTEEDAFILAEKHFGEAAVLKGMLQDVHAVEVHISLVRHSLAAFIATSLILIGFRAVEFGARTMFLDRIDVSNKSTMLVIMAVLVLLAGACALLPWLVFHKWRRQMATGIKPWCYRWPMRSMVGLATGLFLIESFSGAIPIELWLPTPLSIDLLATLLLLVLFAGTANCAAWFWWCVESSRRPNHFAQVAGLWMLLNGAPSLMRGVCLWAGGAPPELGWWPSEHIGHFFFSIGSWMVLFMAMGRMASVIFLKTAEIFDRRKTRMKTTG